MSGASTTGIARFQSTPPARGATIKTVPSPSTTLISIHAPREGGDSTTCSSSRRTGDFNPRPPRGGRLHWVLRRLYPPRFQSTPPARGATAIAKAARIPKDISIHAPREGGDDGKGPYLAAGLNFNPRPPRGGRLRVKTGSSWFNWHFNPRPPRGGRPGISVLPPERPQGFQSTPPARGATFHHRSAYSRKCISIHAPREGGDLSKSVLGKLENYFNPRPPRGGRLIREIYKHFNEEFQSTPPARGATHPLDDLPQGPAISIHAPREGGDYRPPVLLQRRYISIHAPREGGDQGIQKQRINVALISIHAPREGGDPVSPCCRQSGRRDFNPRPPRGGRPFQICSW